MRKKKLKSERFFTYSAICLFLFFVLDRLVQLLKEIIAPSELTPKQISRLQEANTSLNAVPPPPLPPVTVEQKNK